MRKTLELIGIAALAALFYLTWSALYGPHRLPGRIPTHFDAAGHPNGWGPPAGILFLPVLAAVLYLLMSIVTRFPDTFHYPVRATPANIERLKSITLAMIAWLKTELACLFCLLQGAFIASARSGDGRLFPLILPFFTVIVFATIACAWIAMFRTAPRRAAR